MRQSNLSVCYSVIHLLYHVCITHRKVNSVTWCPCLQNADSNACPNYKTLILQESNYILRKTVKPIYFDEQSL